MPPTVSINLCCYNSEKYLEETLQSIFAQSYKDWELIIINDGSSDATESIVKQYITQGYPIIYHFQKNHGLGYSRNEALKRSRGKYIAFIDHDDIWMPEKLSKQVSFFEYNPSIDFQYSNYFILDQEKSKKSVAYKKLQPSGLVFEHFLYRYSVGILTVFVRKKVFDKLDGLFDDKLILTEDYDVFMRILYDAKASYMPEPLAIYRIHSNMASLRFIENYPDELDYVSEKLKELDKNNLQKYAKALENHKVQFEYIKIKIKMAQGDLKKARNHLTLYKFFNHKFFVLYCASYLPLSLWFFLRPLWQKDTFR